MTHPIPTASVAQQALCGNDEVAAAHPHQPYKPIAPSQRLASLPTYIFAQLNQFKAQAVANGISLIDLGMGNPDMPTPASIIEALTQAVANPVNHRYPDFEGKATFRQAVAGWMHRRYDVSVDPDTAIQPLIGTKEGLAHLIQALVDPGDVMLVPTLYYPTYLRAAVLNGAEVHWLPISQANNYLPDLTQIPPDVAKRAKLMLVNYPNNPTGAMADEAFYHQAVAFCRHYGIALVNDMAYGELLFDGQRQPSILSIEGAEDVAIEFHSFSKSFNMAGWRMGWAVGNTTLIKALYTLKTNLDYGACNAVQDGATFALDHAETLIPPIVQTYQNRRNVVSQRLQAMGWAAQAPKGSFYYWLPVPQGFAGSMAFSQWLILNHGVVLTPGIAFGQAGDGFMRLSLVSPEAQLNLALDRIEAANLTFTS